MCYTIGKIENNKDYIIGYKVAIKKRKHYYSIATGVRYKIGNVIKPKRAIPLQNTWRFDPKISIENNMAFNKDMYGLTSAFYNKNDAIRLYENLSKYKPTSGRIVLIRITLGGLLKTGIYSGNKVFLGNTILNIFEEKVNDNLIEIALSKKQTLRLIPKTE